MKTLRMLFRSLSILSFLPIAIFPNFVYAHLENPSHFLKINGKHTNHYQITSTSLEGFMVPNHQAPENYIVNQTINFEVDTLSLKNARGDVDQDLFIFDFSGGETIENQGKALSYVFKTPGSHVLKLYSKTAKSPTPELLQTTLIHILPFKDYPLPKAVISIDGKIYKSSESLLIDFKDEFSFDAKESISSSIIIEHSWDLGNKVLGKDASFIYEYPENPYSAYVILRIKNADGFISDSFVELKDEELFSKSEAVRQDSNVDFRIAIAIVIGIFLALIGYFL